MYKAKGKLGSVLRVEVCNDLQPLELLWVSAVSAENRKRF